MKKTKILKIVKKKEDDRKFLKRCLSTHTCIKCGSDLKSKIYEPEEDRRNYVCKNKMCGAKFSD